MQIYKYNYCNLYNNSLGHYMNTCILSWSNIVAIHMRANRVSSHSLLRIWAQTAIFHCRLTDKKPGKLVLEMVEYTMCAAYRWSSAFLFSSSAIVSNCSTTCLTFGSCCSFGLPPRCSVETSWLGSSVLSRSITYLLAENCSSDFF